MSKVNNTNGDLKSSDDQKETVSGTFTESNGIKSSALAETLWGIPIVNGSIETFKKYEIGRYTCDLAETGARKVSDLAKPVSVKFSDHIEKADKIAAASVQRLSTSTDKIFSTLKEPAIQTITTVRQYHEQLGGTIENNITTPGSRFVMKVDSRLTPLVNAIEDILQKMIPDENGKTNRDIQNDQQQIAQTLRFLHIASATRDRCVEKVKKQLTTTQSYTTEQLRQLQESNQFLSRATDTVNTLNQTLLGMVVNLRETVQNPDLAALQARLQAVIFKDEDNLPKAVQARIVELSSALLTATDGIGTYIILNAKNFPEYLQERLKPLVNYFEEPYNEIANEIKNGKGSPIEKSKNILHLTTNHTLPLLHTSLSDLQEAIQCYKNTLNTSFYNTTDAVKNQLNSATQILNVK